MYQNFYHGLIVCICAFIFSLSASAKSEHQQPKAKENQVSLSLLHGETPASYKGKFSGRLDVREVHTLLGCTDEGVQQNWVVLEGADYFVPIAKVTTSQFIEIEKATDNAKNNPYEVTSVKPWGPEIFKKSGFNAGDYVTLHGAMAVVMHSGSIGSAPIYGVFFTSIELQKNEKTFSFLAQGVDWTSETSVSTFIHKALIKTGMTSRDAFNELQVLKENIAQKPQEVRLKMLTEKLKSLSPNQ